MRSFYFFLSSRLWAVSVIVLALSWRSIKLKRGEWLCILLCNPAISFHSLFSPSCIQLSLPILLSCNPFLFAPVHENDRELPLVYRSLAPRLYGFANLVLIGSTSRLRHQLQLRYLKRDAHWGKEMKTSIHSVHRWLWLGNDGFIYSLRFFPCDCCSWYTETSPTPVLHLYWILSLNPFRGVRMTWRSWLSRPQPSLSSFYWRLYESSPGTGSPLPVVSCSDRFQSSPGTGSPLSVVSRSDRFQSSPGTGSPLSVVIPSDRFQSSPGTGSPLSVVSRSDRFQSSPGTGSPLSVVIPSDRFQSSPGTGSPLSVVSRSDRFNCSPATGLSLAIVGSWIPIPLSKSSVSSDPSTVYISFNELLTCDWCSNARRQDRKTQKDREVEMHRCSFSVCWLIVKASCPVLLLF